MIKIASLRIHRKCVFNLTFRKVGAILPICDDTDRSRGPLGLTPLLPNPTEADYQDVCYAEDALTTGVGR